MEEREEERKEKRKEKGREDIYRGKNNLLDPKKL